MLVPRIQSASRICKPMVKNTTEASKKKLQQISLAGIAKMMISEPIKANAIKCGGGESSCSSDWPWSLTNPDLYSC